MNRRLKILFLNQTFHPDVMATGQYLTEVAVRLAERGHAVTVVTARRAYDRPREQFASCETWRGIRIFRVFSTGFGKSTRWRRAADFASFICACCARLLLLPRQDVVVALTTPPLISFIGACLARLHGNRFVYWVMDFNPDEAIAAGWLRADSIVGRALERMSRFSLRHADKIIALDRFMRSRIVAKGVVPSKVAVIAPWAHDTEVKFDPAGRERFRKVHGLDGKFVVMYSGNHSPVHPLDTLLRAARCLAHERDIVFCFVGGGSEWRKIAETQKAEDRNRELGIGNRKFKIATAATANFQMGPHILCLPYQPLDQLAGSLSAADLHVVVMGDAMVGLVHPCKIYNILSVVAPVLYIGPQPSHITDIMDALNHEYPFLAVAHGNIDGTVRGILQIRGVPQTTSGRNPFNGSLTFSKDAVLSRLVAELEQ